MALIQTTHQLTRRPGTWGAGFLVRDANSLAGFIVYAFEHINGESARLIQRRRITEVAAANGIAPCYAQDLPEGTRRAEFCFEIDPAGRIYPHAGNHPAWNGPEAPWARTLLLSLGLGESGVEN